MSLTLAVVDSTVVRLSHLCNEHGKPHTVSSLFNIQPWYDHRIPESLRNEHGKPHTVSSLLNRGTRVAFPKVYVSTVARKDWLRHVACCIVQYGEQS